MLTSRSPNTAFQNLEKIPLREDPLFENPTPKVRINITGAIAPLLQVTCVRIGEQCRFMFLKHAVQWEGLWQGEPRDLCISLDAAYAAVLSKDSILILGLDSGVLLQRVVLEGHVEPLCAVWIDNSELAVFFSSGVLVTLKIDRVGSGIFCRRPQLKLHLQSRVVLSGCIPARLHHRAGIIRPVHHPRKLNHLGLAIAQRSDVLIWCRTKGCHASRHVRR